MHLNHKHLLPLKVTPQAEKIVQRQKMKMKMTKGKMVQKKSQMTPTESMKKMDLKVL